jgi:hypothetical protein
MTSVQIPNSSSCVSVYIINTSWAYHLPCGDLFKPPFKGLDTFDICSYAFLVIHEDGKGKSHTLFDLGIRKDWENLVPEMVELLKTWKAIVKVDKDASEILVENGVDLNDIDAIVWR